MRLDPVDQIVGKRIDLPGDAERAVAQMASGAAGDLAELGGVEVAVLVAVELAVLGKGDVVEIEVEAHADGVGGDEIVDIAGLVERHLRVAGARAQRTEHHRRAAALAADQLGDGIDLVGGEGDDGAAAGQPRQLLRAGIGEVREPRPGDHRNAAQQTLQNAAHGGGAEQQRLLAAAQMQDAVGEDVAALEIAGELDLVDRHEGGVGLARHRLDRADRIFRADGDDLLFAGDQRHLVRADLLADAGIDLARQQPERQADDAALMRHHALDGEMRLAGIGRTEDRRHVASGEHEGVGLFGLEVHREVSQPFWLVGPEIGSGAVMRKRIYRLIARPRHLQELWPSTQAECCSVNRWNESGTNRRRITDSSRFRFCSPQHLAGFTMTRTTC